MDTSPSTGAPHGHSHSHEVAGDWARARTLRAVTVAVVVTAVATLVGVIALWPTGEGRETAIARAEEIGLATDRVSATVEESVDRRCSYSTAEDPQTCRLLTLTINEGPDAGAVVALPEINLLIDRSVPQLSVGDPIVLALAESTNTYFYADRDRRDSLVWLAGLFAVVVVALGRMRGALALVSMASTIFVLVGFVAPSVLDGNDPVLVAVVAASAIAFVSLYLTHGTSAATTVALAGTLAALGLTLLLASLFFDLASFTGFASDEALVLPFLDEDLDLVALLLGGAIIGTLGALDDVTITQVATVAELRHRSPSLPVRELITSGIRVGREHIASTINTLLLAYAGASMPILLLFAVSDQSLDMAANSELVAVEIVRTLCGSIGLVAAVPITTVLAAIVATPPEPSPATEEPSTEPPDWADFAPQDDFDDA